MTTVYREDGGVEPVTVIEVGPCVVTQVKTKARDGYEAVQLGFGAAKKLSKAEAGHLERANGKFRHLLEFKVKDLGEYEVGKTLRADVFQTGEIVKVSGTSKGRGFQGGVKRHHFHGDQRRTGSPTATVRLARSAQRPTPATCGGALAWRVIWAPRRSPCGGWKWSWPMRTGTWSSSGALSLAGTTGSCGSKSSAR